MWGTFSPDFTSDGRVIARCAPRHIDVVWDDEGRERVCAFMKGSDDDDGNVHSTFDPRGVWCGKLSGN